MNEACTGIIIIIIIIIRKKEEKLGFQVFYSDINVDGGLLSYDSV